MKYKGFIRNTSLISATGRRVVNLPEDVWKKMGWNINENIIITTVTDKDNKEYVMIEKENNETDR